MTRKLLLLQHLYWLFFHHLQHFYTVFINSTSEEAAYTDIWRQHIQYLLPINSPLSAQIYPADITDLEK